MSGIDLPEDAVSFISHSLLDALIPRRCPDALLVYMLIEASADVVGRCWPTPEAIGETCRLSVPAVHHALDVLEEVGAVTWDRDTGTYYITDVRPDGGWPTSGRGLAGL